MTSVADHFAETVALLKTWGFPVVELDGWRTRRARSDIAFAPQAVVNHHTGAWTTSDGLLFRTGRTGLPAPLCHWTIYPDGTIVLGAAGYANHAGINNEAAVAKLLAGGPLDSEIVPGADAPGYSANRRTIGIEVKCPAAYNATQRAAAVALNAALVMVFDWSRTRPPVGAHKEITRRKPGDPGDAMGGFRAAVVAYIAAHTGTPNPKPTPKPVVTYPATIRKGSKGRDVEALQTALRKLGIHGDLLNRKPLVVDKVYGTQTRRAVKRYQKAHHLTVDGVCGRQTWTSLGITK